MFLLWLYIVILSDIHVKTCAMCISAKTNIKRDKYKVVLNKLQTNYSKSFKTFILNMMYDKKKNMYSFVYKNFQYISGF